MSLDVNVLVAEKGNVLLDGWKSSE